LFCDGWQKVAVALDRHAALSDALVSLAKTAKAAEEKLRTESDDGTRIAPPRSIGAGIPTKEPEVFQVLSADVSRDRSRIFPILPPPKPYSSVAIKQLQTGYTAITVDQVKVRQTGEVDERGAKVLAVVGGLNMDVWFWPGEPMYEFLMQAAEMVQELQETN